MYLLSQKVFSGLQSWVEVVGISTKTREKKKRKRKEQPNLCFGFSLLCFPFPLTKFNLSSLFGPILASFCDSAGLTWEKTETHQKEEGEKSKPTLRFGWQVVSEFCFLFLVSSFFLALFRFKIFFGVFNRKVDLSGEFKVILCSFWWMLNAVFVVLLTMNLYFFLAWFLFSLHFFPFYP